MNGRIRADEEAQHHQGCLILRGAFYPSVSGISSPDATSEGERRSVYVRGSVMREVMVSTKKGKNCASVS